MKFYIDCVSGYSLLMNEYNEIFQSNHGLLMKRATYIRLFHDCFIKDCEKSQCGRPVIELQILLKNLSDAIDTISDSESEQYGTQFRKALGLALKGITESNCADFSDHYKPERKPETEILEESPDYELAFCDVCFQMTNHLDGVCQKHNKDKTHITM